MGGPLDQFQRDVKLAILELKAKLDALAVAAGVSVAEDAADPVGPQPTVRVIAGTNVTVDVVEDPANSEIDVTISASGGGGVSDGDKGDITVSGGGTNWQIDADTIGTSELQNAAVEEANIADSAVATDKIADAAVTYAKFQDVNEDRLLGRSAGSGAGVVEEIKPSPDFALSGGELNLTHLLARGRYAPGSFTLATGQYGYVVKQLRLVSTDRATLEGDARLVVEN